jgi:hypothetical protein
LSNARQAAKATAATTELFTYEVRRSNRPLVLLRGLQDADGATVEAEIYPASDPPPKEAIRRPYTFSSAAHATRFADEAVLALEYLGCTIVV